LSTIRVFEGDEDMFSMLRVGFSLLVGLLLGFTNFGYRIARFFCIKLFLVIFVILLDDDKELWLFLRYISILG